MTSGDDFYILSSGMVSKWNILTQYYMYKNLILCCIVLQRSSTIWHLNSSGYLNCYSTVLVNRQNLLKTSKNIPWYMYLNSRKRASCCLISSSAHVLHIAVGGKGGGTRDSKWWGWSKNFFGFEVFNSIFFFGGGGGVGKFGKYCFVWLDLRCLSTVFSGPYQTFSFGRLANFLDLNRCEIYTR